MSEWSNLGFAAAFREEMLKSVGESSRIIAVVSRRNT